MNPTPPQPEPSDPAAALLQREVCEDAVESLRDALPPPRGDTPEAWARRNRVALAKVLSMVPANPVEADLAASHVIAMAWAREYTRRAGLQPDDLGLTRQLDAQAASRGREARGFIARLESLQAARRKREATGAGQESTEWTVQVVHALMTEAMERLPPIVPPAPPATAAGARRPRRRQAGPAAGLRRVVRRREAAGPHQVGSRPICDPQHHARAGDPQVGRAAARLRLRAPAARGAARHHQSRRPGDALRRHLCALGAAGALKPVPSLRRTASNARHHRDVAPPKGKSSQRQYPHPTNTQPPSTLGAQHPWRPAPQRPNTQLRSTLGATAATFHNAAMNDAELPGSPSAALEDTLAAWDEQLAGLERQAAADAARRQAPAQGGAGGRRGGRSPAPSPNSTTTRRSFRRPWASPPPPRPSTCAAAFASGAFLAELARAAAAAGVTLVQRDGRISAYPLVLRLEPRTQAVRIGRKLERRIRPSFLARHLRALQQRPNRFNARARSRPPVPRLRRCWPPRARRTGSPTAPAKARSSRSPTCTTLLTLLPAAAADYPLEEFLLDLLRLDRQPDARTGRGHRFELGGSTGTKGAKRLTAFDETGAQHDYYAIRFVAE